MSCRVTLTDVAKKSGVSISTASRVFSRPGRVSAETTKRVFEAANELGYHQDVELIRDALQSKPTYLFAITVADIANPVYASYIEGAQLFGRSKGIGVITLNAQENSDMEKFNLQLVLEHVDGVIMASSRLSEDSIRKMAGLKPTVVLNRPIRGVTSILCDPKQGIREMVRKLKSLGHDSITYLAGPPSSWQDGARWRSLIELCAAYQIKLRRIRGQTPDSVGGGKCAALFLTKPSSAVLAFNDNMAIGFMAAMHSYGVSVPGQVSVIGIDDIAMDLLTVPSLSTVRPGHIRLGHKAASILYDNVFGEESAHTSAENMVVTRSSFIARESIAKARSSELRVQ